MDINLSLSPALGIPVNYLVVAVYNSTAPATVVASQSFPAPHSAPVNITFVNLNSGVYYVITYESVDGTPTGTVRHQFIYDPSYSTANIRFDIVLIAGETPGFPVGATGYIDVTWVGWTGRIERRSAGGTLIDVAVQTSGAEVQFLLTGGFQLLIEGDAAAAGEIFIVHFDPQIIDIAPSVSQTAGVLWSMEKDIVDAASGIIAVGDMGKYCVIAATTLIVLPIALPALNSVPDGTMIAFLSEGGTHLAANLTPNGSDQIKWLSDVWTASDPLTICQSEEIWLASHGGFWRVMMSDGGWRQVGEFVEGLSLEAAPAISGGLYKNVLPLDGNLYVRSYYPRLWRWINKKLNPLFLISDSTWQLQDTGSTSGTYLMYLNTGKFSLGDGTSIPANFRMPLYQLTLDGSNNIKSGGYLRAVSGSATTNPVTGVPDLATLPTRDSVGNFGAKITGLEVQKGGNTVRVVVLGNSTDRPDATTFGNPEIGPLLFTGTNVKSGVNNQETRPFTNNIYRHIRF